MARSRKKSPVIADRSPYFKNQANRVVRRFKGKTQNGKWYKKLYCSYNIKDYWWDTRDASRWEFEAEEEFLERKAENIAHAYRK